MVIHELDGAPPPELQRALEAFEAAFRVPYAAGRFYRISYGSDRTAFVRTLGEGKCYAAEREGRIIGFLEIAVVNLLLPRGAARGVHRGYQAPAGGTPEAHDGADASKRGRVGPDEE
jgi:hypothetical protein